MPLEAFAVTALERYILIALKVLLHHGVHMPLVGLEAQDIVRPMRVQLGCNVFLAANGVYGDDAPAQVQQTQELRDGRDFVALSVDLALSQQQPHVGRPGADHVQGFGGIALAAAAHAFAINGHCALHLTGELSQPLLAGLLQLLGVEQAKHPGKGVVRGHPGRQGDKACKPVAVQLPKLRNFHPVVCASDGGAQCNSQDGLQFVPTGSVGARVLDDLQVLQQAHGGFVRLKPRSFA